MILPTVVDPGVSVTDLNGTEVAVTVKPDVSWSTTDCVSS